MQNQTQYVIFVMERMQIHEVTALGRGDTAENPVPVLTMFSDLRILEIHRKGEHGGGETGGKPSFFLMHPPDRQLGHRRGWWPPGLLPRLSQREPQAGSSTSSQTGGR